MKHSIRGNLKPTAGTAREQRFPWALAPEYAQLDQRNCADQMSAALEFAKLLAYYDESNQQVGDWSDFFRSDISFLLAQIATSNFQREGYQIGALQSTAREGRADIRQILHAIYRMANRLDSWYLWSREIAEKDLAYNGSDSGIANDIFKKLEVIVQNLKQNLGENLKSLLQGLAPTRGEEDWTGYWEEWESKLSEIWRPQTELAEGRPRLLAPIASMTDTSPLEGLLSVLRWFQEANLGLGDFAGQHLEDAIVEHSDHPPHTALYMAFARLLDLLRDKINALTGSHLDFYYHEVLQLREKGSTPDVVHLSFETVPEIKEFKLLAGTRLSAGKDPSGALREYATDADLFINHGRIAAVKALYLARDNFNTSAHEPDRVMSILRFPKCDSEDGLGAPLADPATGWPTFGLNEMTTHASERLQLHTDIGFVLASSALLLREGERNVTISLAFDGESSLEEALGRYQKVAEGILDRPPSIDVLMADAFDISLSTEKGWLPVRASYRRHPVVGTAMEIEFTLQPADPPVVANAALSPEPQTPWPMLKLALNPLARIFAYSFFKNLTIKTIDIRVSVRGVKALQLHNQVGLLSAGQPFPVFGPVPAQGSYLLLSHPELTVKDVSHATINITWLNLPRPPASLASHYAAYNLGIGDESFKIRLSVYADGNRGWVAPSDTNEIIPLFTRDFDRSGLLTTTAIAVGVDQLPPPANDPAVAEPVTADQFTDSQAPRGTIRIELTEPEFGFGQTVYPQIMTNAATANARAGKNGPYTPIPNPPLTPVARSVTLDYDASDRLDLTRPLPEERAERFYCIDSFGYTEHRGRAPSMLPQLEEQGHLYLGFAEIGPRQSLSLLFQIRDSGYSKVPSLLHHQDEKTLLLKWRYLSNNEWKDYPETLLLSDSTMGLTRSGIVKFKLPEDITSGNTRMPAEFCWIQAALPQVAGAYWCNVVSVDTQAMTATRVVISESELVPLSLPGGSISQLSVKRPEIKSVRQPFASSGGRNKEDIKAFRTRVSERLRHKGRAVQPCDYERLVLQEFPEVGQVKCITNNNSRVSFRTPAVPPGVIYLVATPRLEEHPEREPHLPQYVLKKIEDFITPLASPMVKDIHVINPVYETIKIFATVEFSAEGDDTGFADDLDEAISQYLQPWRQEPFKPMPIGSGQVQGYQLSKFIQEQNYVKQLHALKMLHTYQTEDKQAGREAKGNNIDTVGRWLSEENRTWASGPWAVVLPAARHSIVSVAPGATPAEIEKGIYNLAVGSDFATKWTWKEEKKEKSAELRYFLVIPRGTVVKAARD